MPKPPGTKPRQMELPVMVAVKSGKLVRPAPPSPIRTQSNVHEASPQDKSIYEAITAKYLASLKR